MNRKIPRHLCLALMTAMIAACAKNDAMERGNRAAPKNPTPPVAQQPPPNTQPVDPPLPRPRPVHASRPSKNTYAALSWEFSDPSRRAWSNHVFDVIESEYAALDLVEDASAFCPRFKKMTHDERVSFWGMLVSEVAFRESGWKPTNRSRESEMGTDPVTHEHVYSEGLMQMSYQDTLGNPGCPFDWDKDKHLAPNDPKKTILNPYRNLTCGVLVLAKQIKEHKRIALSESLYWSTLEKGTRKEKDIANSVHDRLRACRTEAEPAFAEADPSQPTSLNL